MLRKLTFSENKLHTFLVLKDSKNVLRSSGKSTSDIRVTRGERGDVSPALFRNLEKIALILGKNALITVIYGLNFSFKMQLLRVSGRKN